MAHATNPDPSSPAPRVVRRTFLSWTTYALGAAATLLLAIPFVGYLLGALRVRQVGWIPLGRSSDFPLGETRLTTFRSPLGQPWDGMADRMGVYVRRQSGDQFLVFAMNCAHLGCPVTWFPQSGLFLCPCHGGVYYENGDRASGPPPRGLFQCAWRVRDGQLEIQAPHLPTLQNPG
jgi:Rieske Fe-S protein